jgi:hypothetical protein
LRGIQLEVGGWQLAVGNYYDFNSTGCNAAFLAGNHDAKKDIRMTVNNTKRISEGFTCTG